MYVYYNHNDQKSIISGTRARALVRYLVVRGRAKGWEASKTWILSPLGTRLSSVILRLKGCIKRRRVERLYRYNAGVPTLYAARYGAFGNRNGERSATVPHLAIPLGLPRLRWMKVVVELPCGGDARSEDGRANRRIKDKDLHM